MADKIVVMQNGYIEQVGSPLDVYDSPANTFVAGFIGSPAMNMLEGQVRSTGNGLELDIGQTSLALPAMAALKDGQEIIAGIRPEDLTPSEAGILAKIAVIEPTGSETHLLLRGNDQDLTSVLRERRNYSPGQDIYLSADPDTLHIFDSQSKQRLH